LGEASYRGFFGFRFHSAGRADMVRTGEAGAAALRPTSDDGAGLEVTDDVTRRRERACCCEMREEDEVPRSLASHVGRWAAVQVTTLILLTHAVFFVAQFIGVQNDCPTSPSDFEVGCRYSINGLSNIKLGVGGSFRVEGLLARGVQELEQKYCDTRCPDAPSVSTDSLQSYVCSSIKCARF
jgi:hypothetical protein